MGRYKYWVAVFAGLLMLLMPCSLKARQALATSFREESKALIDSLAEMRQLPDSLIYQPDSSLFTLPKERVQWLPNSQKAMLWALLPGGGQIYNRKYWKVPIVWGAFTATFYAIRWNQRMYEDYHAAYRDLSSADPSVNTAWLDFAPRGTNPQDWQQYSSLKSALQRGDEYYHRWRDISIVIGVAVYALSILDAYVDAELATFDISPDLSLKVYPQLSPNPLWQGEYKLALGCSLRF